MNEPNVPTYSQHISQLCLRLKITAWSANEARASAMSFMPNHAASEASAIGTTQMKPAFCSHRLRCAPPAVMVCGSPPRAPNTPIEITTGTTNCTSDTPRLPMPAFRPVARPFFSFGKKKLMLAMLELKLPPPRPHNSASTSSVGNDVVGSRSAKPMPSAGSNSEAVEIAVHLRPPNTGTRNE